MRLIYEILSLWSLVLLLSMGSCNNPDNSQTGANNKLDKQVREFLNNSKNNWRDMNVPETDGQLLYNLVIKNKYKNAVEIGTSTGHSAIWIAWALSKTHGKLITIEIDKRRHLEALANFEKAGLLKFIDARLADAHQLVPALKGPIDFVFSDADKNWYVNYFKDIDPKLSLGGCFVTHNVSQNSNSEFYDYVMKLPNYKTTLDNQGAGMAISYKTGK